MSPDLSPDYAATLARRIAASVMVDAHGCWLWQGATNSRGYGQIAVRRAGRTTPVATSVHRLALQLSGARLDGDAFACHHCDVRACCNPSHLYVGDLQSNRQDAVARGRVRNPVADRNAAKTHCPAGHPYSDENTRVLVVHGRTERRCVACAREAGRRARRRAAQEAA